MRKPSAVPWMLAARGHDIRTTSTRAPFSVMWVKTENWRTPQDVPSGHIIAVLCLPVKAFL
jgi:hypothetical protein